MIAFVMETLFVFFLYLQFCFCLYGFFSKKSLAAIPLIASNAGLRFACQFGASIGETLPIQIGIIELHVGILSRLNIRVIF